jgi:acetamidase/formamidase
MGQNQRVILQPGEGPIDGRHYLRATPDTVHWGVLPARGTPSVLEIDPGDVVTIDTVSHEGILEEFDRDPASWFGARGVARDEVLDDAIDIASTAPRDPKQGPHVLTGPIHVRGARPGDLLKIDVLRVQLRVPYGVISSRHGWGALAGEMPEGPGPVWCFTRVVDGRGVLPFDDSTRAARFPIAPFLGVMGVAVDTDEVRSSTPPGDYAGNIDVAALQAGTSLYVPVQIDGAGFYAGDPHFAQGNGEVCLTALDGSLRADVRIDVLRDEAARTAVGRLRYPFVETDQHWIPIGLHEDLDEAMRDAVRRALIFLESTQGMERHLAYAYLSAAADFEVSQVVDVVKGIHCKIRKSDFT